MDVIRNILVAFIEKCKKAGRYGEGNCLFNARIILSLLLSLNLISLMSLLFGKYWSLKHIFFSGRSDGHILMLIVPVCFFILLVLFFPKKKLLIIELSSVEQRKAFIYLAIYVAITMILMITTSFVTSGLIG